MGVNAGHHPTAYLDVRKKPSMSDIEVGLESTKSKLYTGSAYVSDGSSPSSSTSNGDDNDVCVVPSHELTQSNSNAYSARREGSLCSFGSSLSMHLRYPELFMGVTPFSAMWGFGKHWKTASLSGQDLASLTAYACQVTALDDFISHCWRDSRQEKHVGLLLIYNATPSIILASFVGVLLYALQWLRYLPQVAPKTGVEVNFWGPRDSPSLPFFPWCTLGGSFAVAFVFIFWQYALAAAHRLSGLSLERRVFFDRMCVEQDDVDAKTKQILDLGAYLSKSGRMVILWSEAYLKRMWCVFEVATFAHMSRLGVHEAARLDIVPLPLVKLLPAGFGFIVFGCGVAALTMVAVEHEEVFLLGIDTDHMLNLLNSPVQALGGFFALSWQVVVVFGLPIFVWLHGIRGYVQNRGNLASQLDEFDIMNAECYDQRDRERVQRTIDHWFGNGESSSGTEALNEYVRGPFKKEISKRIGGVHIVPFRYALLVFLPTFFLMLDFAVSISYLENPALERAWLLGSFNFSFLLCPMFCTLLLKVAGQPRRTHSCLCFGHIERLFTSLIMGAILCLGFRVLCIASGIGMAAQVPLTIAYGLTAWKIFRRY
jgi:hypothetical protein